MKRLTILLAAVFYCLSVNAQTDTGSVTVRADTTVKPKRSDTMHIGNILIIKRGGKGSNGKDSSVTVIRQRKNASRVSTNWVIVDLGFANYNDKTNYINATADGYLVNRPGAPLLGKDDFKLRTGKSINVNIWFFIQQLNIIKQNVSLKYGLGLELNNYRYKSAVSYKEDGAIPYTNTVTNKPFIFRDSLSFSKNKLAADYLTVPVMLNFSTYHPGKKGFNLAFGVSGGYLYGQRNKQRSDALGKQKNKGDYDLEKFKFSYIGELGVGPVKFYASYTPKSIYEHSLDMRPYNFGIRFSN